MFHSNQCQPANLYQIHQEDGKLAAVENLSCWFLNSFRMERRFKKVTFVLDPALQRATWRRNRLTCRKRKVSNFGCIISLPLKPRDKRQPRSFVAFVSVSDFEALLNRKVEFISFTRWCHFVIHFWWKPAHQLTREREHGGARLTAVPDYDRVNHLVFSPSYLTWPHLRCDVGLQEGK